MRAQWCGVGLQECAWDRYKVPTPVKLTGALCIVQTAPVIAEQRKKDQKAVDALLMKKLANEPYLRAYLNAKFTLTKNDRVHDMRF
jgi:hypothetical protein